MPAYFLWLAFGVACLAAEAMGVSGIGLLFAGLGALTVGSIITAVEELSALHQWIIFFLATGFWTVFLWKPLQKWRGKTSGEGFKNIVGDTVFIGTSGLKPGDTGEATWSGTIMRAQLAAGEAPLPGGAQAIVMEVKGNTLIVKSK